MDENTIKEKIQLSIKEVGEESPSLPFESIGEQALVARLFLHLQGKFDGHMIDSEYSRDLKNGTTKVVEFEQKMASIEGEVSEERRIRRVRPDIIIHKRTDSGGNLAVIEAKFEDSKQTDKKYDILKVKAIKEKFGYTHAITIYLPRTIERFRDIHNIPNAITFH